MQAIRINDQRRIRLARDRRFFTGVVEEADPAVPDSMAHHWQIKTTKSTTITTRRDNHVQQTLPPGAL
jgi:hypothetical protein